MNVKRLDTVTKTYIEYFFPGLLFSANASEETNKEKKFPKKLPRNCYGFRFYEVTSDVVDGEELSGKAKNYSNLYLIGKEYSFKEVKKRWSNQTILISNLNGKPGVLCHTGTWQEKTNTVTVLNVSRFEFEDRYIG